MSFSLYANLPSSILSMFLISLSWPYSLLWGNDSSSPCHSDSSQGSSVQRSRVVRILASGARPLCGRSSQIVSSSEWSSDSRGHTESILYSDSRFHGSFEELVSEYSCPFRSQQERWWTELHLGWYFSRRSSRVVSMDSWSMDSRPSSGAKEKKS